MVSATKLGDWTANLVIIRRQRLVLAVSGTTLLPVLLPLAPSKTLLSRFGEAVEQVLRGLKIDPARIAAEKAAMAECIVTTTNDRQVLGSLNDFARMLDAYLDGRPLVEVALHLAEAPCRPLGMRCPKEAAQEVLSRPALRLVKG